MSLVISISGIRGTIGGRPGEGLTPLDTVRFTSSYGAWLREQSREGTTTCCIGQGCTYFWSPGGTTGCCHSFGHGD